MFWWRIIPLKLKPKNSKEVAKGAKAIWDTFDKKQFLETIQSSRLPRADNHYFKAIGKIPWRRGFGRL